VPPGRLARRIFPCDAFSGTRPRVGVADACAATRPGSRPQAPAHARAIASPPGCVLVPRGSRATGALPAPPNARAGPEEGFWFSDSTSDARHQTRLLEFLPFSPATRTRRDPPTAFAMTTARAPRLARPRERNVFMRDPRRPNDDDERRRTATDDSPRHPPRALELKKNPPKKKKPRDLISRRAVSARA
jgi:hypothetical protein